MEKVNSKKCPLRQYKESSTAPNPKFSDCIGTNCAWYDDEVKKCVVQSLPSIAETLMRSYHESLKVPI